MHRNANPRVSRTKKASSDFDENDKSQPTEPTNASTKNAGAGSCRSWMLSRIQIERIQMDAAARSGLGACIKNRLGRCMLHCRSNKVIINTWSRLGCYLDAAARSGLGACIRNRLAASQRTKWSCCKPPWPQLKFAAHASKCESESITNEESIE